MRGLAVLAMVLAHTTDAWTRLADRSGSPYRVALLIGGFGAPAFLFLAGITQSLAANARLRRGATPEAAALRALRHGVRIFLLAFLFEVQSWVISRGSFWHKFTRVDILHIMGLVMCAGAVLWLAGRSRRGRTAMLLIAGFCATLTAPIVMTWEGWSQLLPQPLAYYIKPVPTHSIFTLLPWSAFFLFGAAIGLWLDADTRLDQRGWRKLLAGLGAAMAAAAYAASWLPSFYAASDFWTTSPAFFFIRLGVLVAALGLAMEAQRHTSLTALRQVGMSSLFVYWIHVEMVYGAPSRRLHQSLTFWQGAGLWAVLCVVLALLVKAKAVVTTSVESKRSNGVKVPVQITQSLMLNVARAGRRTR
jgi:uncharacterized membrane protein